MTEQEQEEFYNRWALSADNISIDLVWEGRQLTVEVTNHGDRPGLLDLRFDVNCTSRWIEVPSRSPPLSLSQLLSAPWIQIQNVASRPASRFADIAAMDLIGPGETVKRPISLGKSICADGDEPKIVLVVAALTPRQRRAIQKGGVWRPDGNEVVASWLARAPDHLEPLSSCEVWVPSYDPSGKSYEDTFVEVECQSAEEW